MGSNPALHQTQIPPVLDKTSKTGTNSGAKYVSSKAKIVQGAEASTPTPDYIKISDGNLPGIAA